MTKQQWSLVVFSVMIPLVVLIGSIISAVAGELRLALFQFLSAVMLALIALFVRVSEKLEDRNGQLRKENETLRILLMKADRNG